MDTRKVTLVATIVVIALLAVGVGYAYTAYTNNTDNTAVTKYYKIGQYAEDGESHPIISTTANDYKESFTTGINFDTETTAGVTTFTLNGTTVTAIGKNVSTVGHTKLVAFDEDGPIDAPGVVDKTHAKLKIEIASPQSTNGHRVNNNFTLVAKLASDFATADTANKEAATSNFVGYSVLQLDNGVYSGYLYVPLNSLSTGFEVYLGAYLTGDDVTTIVDTNMAFGLENPATTEDGDNDQDLLYFATVRFSIDSTAWVAAA